MTNKKLSHSSEIDLQICAYQIKNFLNVEMTNDEFVHVKTLIRNLLFKAKNKR